MQHNLSLSLSIFKLSEYASFMQCTVSLITFHVITYPFSALMLLVMWQVEHLASASLNGSTCVRPDLNSVTMLVTQHKWSHTPSLGSLVVDKERVRLVRDFPLLRSLLCVSDNALILFAEWPGHLACNSLCHLSSKVLRWNKWRRKTNGKCRCTWKTVIKWRWWFLEGWSSFPDDNNVSHSLQQQQSARSLHQLLVTAATDFLQSP